MSKVNLQGLEKNRIIQVEPYLLASTVNIFII